MKRLVFCFAIIMASMSSIVAQNMDKSQGFRAGVLGGINLSKLNTDVKSRIGIQVGVKVEYDMPSSIAPGLFLDGALLYSGKGVRYDSKNSAAFHYLELPVNVGYKYQVNDKLAVFGKSGFWVSYLLETDPNLLKLALKNMDFGLGISAGCEIQKHYQFNIGYECGLGNIWKVDEHKEPGSVYDTNTRNFYISVAYMF
jgi:hypothetical protein